MHPGGGQYDCLSLWDLKTQQAVMQINRGGSLHVFPSNGGADQSIGDWIFQMATSNSQQILDRLCELLRLPVPAKLPHSTPTTITYRFVTELLTHSIGRLENWRCLNGCLDSSGWSSGIRHELFAKFPSVETDSLVDRAKQSKFCKGFDYWFLLRDDEPQFCLQTNGHAVTVAGDKYDLNQIYQKYHRIWPVIMAVAKDQLP
jgi:hypothetical protein